MYLLLSTTEVRTVPFVDFSFFIFFLCNRFQDVLIKKGIVEKDDVLRGKGIDPDELRLEEAIVR